MLPSPTIAGIESLQAQIKEELKAEKADPAYGWPDNFHAIILNMIERDPSFLPSEPGHVNVAVADIVGDAAVQSSQDNVKTNLDKLNGLLQKRDAKDKRMAWKMAYYTLEWMKQVLKYREENRLARERRAARQEARGGRRSTRGRKSRRKSLRQRK
jgi:hypothetical protein